MPAGTAQRIAAGIPLPRGCRGGAAFVEKLMREERDRGMVEPDGGGGWRLTAYAEAAFGQALRDLDLLLDGVADRQAA